MWCVFTSLSLKCLQCELQYKPNSHTPGVPCDRCGQKGSILLQLFFFFFTQIKLLLFFIFLCSLNFVELQVNDSAFNLLPVKTHGCTSDRSTHVQQFKRLKTALAECGSWWCHKSRPDLLRVWNHFDLCYVFLFIFFFIYSVFIVFS